MGVGSAIAGGVLKSLTAGLDKTRTEARAQEDKDLAKKLHMIEVYIKSPGATAQGRAFAVREMMELLSLGGDTAKAKTGKGKAGKQTEQFDQAEDFFGGLLGALGQFEEGTRGEQAGKPVEFGPSLAPTVPELLPPRTSLAPVVPGAPGVPAEPVPGVGDVPERQGVKFFKTAEDIAEEQRQKMELEAMRPVLTKAFQQQLTERSIEPRFKRSVERHERLLDRKLTDEERQGVLAGISGIELPGADPSKFALVAENVPGSALATGPMKDVTEGTTGKFDPEMNYRIVMIGGKRIAYPIEAKPGPQDAKIASMAANLQIEDQTLSDEAAMGKARLMVLEDARLATMSARERLRQTKFRTNMLARVQSGDLKPNDVRSLLRDATNTARWLKSFSNPDFIEYQDRSLPDVQNEVLQQLWGFSRAELLERLGGKEPPKEKRPRAVNPTTGEVREWDGRQWVTVAPPTKR